MAGTTELGSEVVEARWSQSFCWVREEGRATVGGAPEVGREVAEEEESLLA